MTIGERIDAMKPRNFRLMVFGLVVATPFAVGLLAGFVWGMVVIGFRVAHGWLTWEQTTFYAGHLR